MKTVGLTRCGPTSLGVSTLLTSLFPPISKTFFKVSRWPVLLALLTPFYGPTIRDVFSKVRVKISISSTVGPLEQSPMELALGFPLPQKDPNFPLEGYA